MKKIGVSGGRVRGDGEKGTENEKAANSCMAVAATAIQAFAAFSLRWGKQGKAWKWLVDGGGLVSFSGVVGSLRGRHFWVKYQEGLAIEFVGFHDSSLDM